MSKPLNIGMIGYGFMGRAHSNAYRQVSQFFQREYRPVLKACCARQKDKIKAFAKNWGYESYETDWRKLIERKDIDVIDIGSPNNTHKEIAAGRGQGGQDDPLRKAAGHERGRSRGDVPGRRKSRRARTWSGSTIAACRPSRWPSKSSTKAASAGRSTIGPRTCKTGRLPPTCRRGARRLWRLDVDVAGSGVTGDLLAHSIDTAEWLNGPIARVTAATETFVKERVHAETGKMQPVGIDDACMFLAVFKNGSMGTFESTRYARGRKNFNTFELNGEAGSVYFDLEDPQYLQYFKYADPKTGAKIESHLTGWQKIHVTNPEHPYMKQWWVPGCTIGYEHTFINALADFLESLETKKPVQPDFRSALHTQKVCDAVLASAKSGKWVEI